MERRQDGVGLREIKRLCSTQYSVNPYAGNLTMSYPVYDNGKLFGFCSALSGSYGIKRLSSLVRWRAFSLSKLLKRRLHLPLWGLYLLL